MQNNSRRISLILGGFMAVVLIAGSILPLFRNTSSSTTQTVDPTAAPSATFPPPVTDFSGISIDQLYLHPSGLYTIAQPTGWTILNPVTQSDVAQVGMNNGENLSVIDAYIQKPLTPVADAQAISDTLTRDVLAQTWTRYNRWEETNRRIEDDRLLIDFSIVFNRQDYVARQVSWADNEYIYSVRVVVPSNGIDLLRFLLDTLPATLKPVPGMDSAPFSWQAYYDPFANHILRHPQTWLSQDVAPGRTASIIGAQGETLRVEYSDLSGALDETAASSHVTSVVPNATILSVAPITRGDASGFSVAYAATNVDGEPFSGDALLLSAGDGKLHTANLRFPGSQIDLNAVPAASEAAPEVTPSEATPEAAVTDPNAIYRDYATIMETFNVIPPIPLSADNLPPTLTPLPTLPPTATPTATNTPEPTATSTSTNTPEPTATSTETPVPTATNTNTPVPTATNTAVPPTATSTNTSVPPTATEVPVTATPNS